MELNVIGLIELTIRKVVSCCLTQLQQVPGGICRERPESFLATVYEDQSDRLAQVGQTLLA